MKKTLKFKKQDPDLKIGVVYKKKVYINYRLETEPGPIVICSPGNGLLQDHVLFYKVDVVVKVDGVVVIY